jgi:tellurite resistance protein TerC
MTIPQWLQWGTAAVFIIVLAIDFYVVDRRPHSFTTRDATRWVLVYVGLAVIFTAVLWWEFDADVAGQFAAAYLTEYSLSVDNLFVFLVIMSSFAVPAELQHRVLLVGVLLALGLRAILIVVGVSAIVRFESVFLLFGLFLLWTAYKVAFTESDSEADVQNKPIVRFVSRFLPTHHEYDGHKVVTRIDGKRMLTPMALVMIAIGGTDIMFALDSIPAVLGLTTELFLVMTSNAFALMGLRQLYFLLNGLISRLVHLARGLSVILAFIGIKLSLMGIEAAFGIATPHINTFVSLGVIVGVLAVTTVTSLYATRGEKAVAQATIEDAD